MEKKKNGPEGYEILFDFKFSGTLNVVLLKSSPLCLQIF